MKQQDRELDLARGKLCPICDLPMTKHGNGKHSATRDHLKARSLGTTLNCFDGHNKMIICRDCNVAKGSASLVEFLMRLLREGDAIRAEGVAGIIADIYRSLGEDRGASELVGMSASGKPKKKAAPRPPVLPLPRPTKACQFPACGCRGACSRYAVP